MERMQRIGFQQFRFLNPLGGQTSKAVHEDAGLRVRVHPQFGSDIKAFFALADEPKSRLEIHPHIPRCNFKGASLENISIFGARIHRKLSRQLSTNHLQRRAPDNRDGMAYNKSVSVKLIRNSSIDPMVKESFFDFLRLGSSHSRVETMESFFQNSSWVEIKLCRERLLIAANQRGKHLQVHDRPLGSFYNLQ
jgi:hypothetical protein